MTKTAPGAYAESIREAVKNGARPDQAIRYATADVAMEVIAERVPMDELLDRAAGDPKRAAGIMDAALKQYGIRMTGEELGWLGRVTAEASGMQNHPAFAKVIALEMLKEQNYEQARTAASRVVWQQALDWAVDSASGKLAEAIDTEAVAKYDKENGQEVLSFGSEGTNQDILRRGYPVGGSGGRSEDTGTIREDDSVFSGEGIPEGDSGAFLSLSNSGGITDYDDDFDHFDGNTGVDTEGKSIPAESVNRLRGTTVVDSSGDPIAVYHGTTEMNFMTFEKGDTGFHFGTYEQASRRIAAKEAGPGRMIRAYLNIQKPLYTDTDIGKWNATPFALYLHSIQVLTDAECADVCNLWQTDTGYNSPAAVRLREILTEKGYDGVVYPNSFEGEGDSYMVFRDDQIIWSEITNFGLEGEKGQQSEAIPAADEYSSSLTKGWIVAEHTEADETKQGELIIGKSLSAKAKNYRVYDPKSGEYFAFVEGSRIRNPKIFAGKGGVKPLRPEVIEGLTREYPTGKPSNWQHCKGIATLDFFGEERDAEVHWFQEETAGKHKFKIKKWVE